ncbi:MAG: SDR family NAD(P)-dependent oxidoreductase, partial [Xanthobacteraceae bacterium]|nr:SDR family NAD(P)-dependent oxidoreductase [Xanthobacteraceae bacterium]
MSDETSVPRAALVTGGAQRIGAAIARALARAGYAVAIHCHHSHAAAEGLCSEIAKNGGKAAVVAADLANHAEVTRLIAAAVEAVGPLTLLVNNAGEFEVDDFGALDHVRFDHQFAVNLRAPLFLAQDFA